VSLLARRAALDVGHAAERHVAGDLQARGWLVRARNWRAPYPVTGEIDLVVERAGVLRFVEVKAREDDDSLVLEGLGRGQQRRLRQVADAWLYAHGLPEREAAFLVALVTTNTDPWTIEYLDDAF
jgi:putative endonuclease